MFIIWPSLLFEAVGSQGKYAESIEKAIFKASLQDNDWE